tara:strand:+ start:52 stop:363 length:312 start_codon:yes stop_codon:yes gene_type:complete
MMQDKDSKLLWETYLTEGAEYIDITEHISNIESPVHHDWVGNDLVELKPGASAEKLGIDTGERVKYLDSIEEKQGIVIEIFPGEYDQELRMHYGEEKLKVKLQ